MAIKNMSNAEIEKWFMDVYGFVPNESEMKMILNTFGSVELGTLFFMKLFKPKTLYQRKYKRSSNEKDKSDRN